jgi:biopolymer transport protein TolQ
MEGVVVEQIGQGLAQTDFSLMALFARADWVVQVVMAGLILASVVTWAVILEKWRLLRRYTASADAFEERFWSGNSLQALYRQTSSEPSHPFSSLFVAAMREWAQSDGGKMTRPSDETTRNIERAMSISLGREMADLEARMLLLATVGSVSPFVGLFGTVWGIMNSFQAIAVTRDTNLAVVAPGIAEALFATGLGLLAAIPAVIAYNGFSNGFNRLATRLEIFMDEFIAVVNRQQRKS